MDESDLYHPFTMVTIELIRNEKILSNCKGLIIYLLSTFSEAQ